MTSRTCKSLASEYLTHCITILFMFCTDLRLQLLDVQHNQDLIRSLYGLLMLLPQSEAFKLLRFRLDCIPQYQLLTMKEKYVSHSLTQKLESMCIPYFFGICV